MDVFARGWSPATGTRVAFWFVVAITLVTVPMWGTAVGIGQPAYVYEVSNVTFVSGDAQFESGVGLRGPTLGLDCFFGPRFDRGCVLEQGAVAENVTATLPPFFVSDDPYVANPNTGQMYRRTAAETGSGGEYGLVEVSDETAIRDVARESEETRPWVERAVQNGPGRTTVSHPIDHDRFGSYRSLFVEHEGAMYVVTERFERESVVDDAAGTIHALGVLFGLIAFRRGVRLRSE